MSYGFQIFSGTGALVSSLSSDEPVGVLLDDYVVGAGATDTRTYPAGQAYTSVFACVSLMGDETAGNLVSVSVSGLTVTVQVSNATPWGSNNVRVVVVGK